MSHLAFLVATRDSLPDKSGIDAESLTILIADRERRLRSAIRRMLFTLDHCERWVSGRLNVELYNLKMTSASDLEVLNEEVCRRIDAVNALTWIIDEKDR